MDIIGENKERLEIDAELVDALIFHRNNLRYEALNTPIEQIQYTHLYTIDSKELHKVALILFVDYDGRTKIIKNRYGKDNIIF